MRPVGLCLIMDCPFFRVLHCFIYLISIAVQVRNPTDFRNSALLRFAQKSIDFRIRRVICDTSEFLFESQRVIYRFFKLITNFQSIKHSDAINEDQSRVMSRKHWLNLVLPNQVTECLFLMVEALHILRTEGIVAWGIMTWELLF